MASRCTTPFWPTSTGPTSQPMLDHLPTYKSPWPTSLACPYLFALVFVCLSISHPTRLPLMFHCSLHPHLDPCMFAVYILLCSCSRSPYICGHSPYIRSCSPYALSQPPWRRPHYLQSRGACARFTAGPAHSLPGSPSWPRFAHAMPAPSRRDAHILLATTPALASLD